LDPVILAFLLPTTLKRYCIQIFMAHYFFANLSGSQNSRNKGHAKKTGFTVSWRHNAYAWTLTRWQQ